MRFADGKSIAASSLGHQPFHPTESNLLHTGRWPVEHHERGSHRTAIGFLVFSFRGFVQ